MNYTISNIGSCGFGVFEWNAGRGELGRMVSEHDTEKQALLYAAKLNRLTSR